MQEFFETGEILKEFNATAISLVPKVQNPTRVSEFMPISCCNTIYKCIAKILADRLKITLHTLISNNQSAFTAGRRIINNILLAQEIMKDYHRYPKKTKMCNQSGHNESI